MTVRAMTVKRYHQVLDALRLSQRALAPFLGCSDRLPRAWGMGTHTIPPAVADWLEACVDNRRAHPDPLPPTEEEWRRRTGVYDRAKTARARRRRLHSPPLAPPRKRPRPRPTKGITRLPGEQR